MKNSTCVFLISILVLVSTGFAENIVYLGDGSTTPVVEDELIDRVESPAPEFRRTAIEKSVIEPMESADTVDIRVAIRPGEALQVESDANTIALWHFTEGSGTATGDSSGNGHDGTLANGATWGDGVIVTPIQGATWTTGPLPTPPEFAYDYDWENDATYDLTDAGDSVCHTYTPGDSLWAMVKTTTATYTAEDSAEVIVPEGEEITIEPTLLFSIPIPAGDTVALGEPTEDGRFPVSFTFGGMNDGVIRIYDTTGTVIDSFPNAYGGRSFDISPNGNLVFLMECLCSDSLNGGVDNPYVCQRLYNKESNLLFETPYCIYCKFSKDGEKLGRPTINNVLEPTEWDVHSIMIIDTLSNRILYFYIREGFSVESKIYESSLSENFTKIWKIGIDTLWIYDDEKNVLAEVPDFWGGIKPEGVIEWNYFINKVDNNEHYWRIAPIGRPINTLLVISYDTLGNQIRSLSLDFENVQSLSCGISDEGDYLWATVSREQADSCLIYSTVDGVEIIGFEIPISHEYDSLKRLREVSIESSIGFYLGDGKAIAISCIKELGNGREIIVTDMNGVLLFGLPKAMNHYENKFESYKFTGDGKYLIAVRNETIFAYRIWR